MNGTYFVHQSQWPRGLRHRSLIPQQSIKILVHSLSQGNEFVIYSSVHIQETHQCTHHTLERVVSHSLGTQMMEVATGTTVVFVLVRTCKPVFQHCVMILKRS